MINIGTRWSKIALAGVLVGTVGSVGPWASWTIDEGIASLGDVPATGTIYGFEGDGLISLVLVLLAGSVILVRGEHRIGAAVSAVLGLVTAGFGLYKYLDLLSVIDEIPSSLESEIQISPGIGLYLVILGGVVVLAAGLYGVASPSVPNESAQNPS